MLSSQELLNRIQKQVGVPWQSQRPDGLSDGILLGDPQTQVTGIVTTYDPSIAVLKRAVKSGKNTLICREGLYYSRGEKAPAYFREGPAPAKEVLDADAVYQSKNTYIAEHNLVIIRLMDNWDARPTDAQLEALADKLGWEKFHQLSGHAEAYDSRNGSFHLPVTSLKALAREIENKLNTKVVRVIGNGDSALTKVALMHGLVLLVDVQRSMRESNFDVLVAGDVVEWEVGPYFQDLVTAGMAKGLILTGMESSEEPGMGKMAEWLKSFVPEVPVEWVSSNPPFWKLD